MTTNRLGDVDDAIASRCIARIDYEMPSSEDQARIWEVLNRLNGVGLSEQQMQDIVQEFNDLSGRDIKQLLKLGSLWAARHEQPVDVDTIRFARRFLPTRATGAQALERTS